MELSVSIVVNGKDTACALNLPASTIHTISSWRERILKVAEVTIGSAYSEVVSLSQHPGVDGMGIHLLEWTDGWTRQRAPLRYLTLQENSIFLVSWQKVLDNDDQSVAKAEFKGSHGWFDRFWGKGSFTAQRLLKRVFWLILKLLKSSQKNWRK